MQHAPRVHLVFWGPEWTPTSPPVTTAQAIFSKLTGGSYNQMLTSYSDASGPITNYMTWDVVMDTDPANAPPPHGGTPITTQTLADEAARVSAANPLPNSADTQWMFYPQQGTPISGTSFCGQHDAVQSPPAGPTWIVGEILYASDIGIRCTGYSPTDNNAEAMGVVSTHEYFEAATDPTFSGWSSDSTGEEVGDICANPKSPTEPTAGTVEGNYVQWEYDIAQSGCALTSPRCCTVTNADGTSGPYADHWRIQDGAQLSAEGVPTSDPYPATVGLQQDFSKLKVLDNSGTFSTRAYPSSAGYTADGWGGIHPFGAAAPGATATGYWPGWNAIRGIVTIPGGQTGGYTLDLWGGLHQFGGAPGRMSTGYWPGWDIARGIALDPCDPTGTSGYVLDGWGGVHQFGTAPGLAPSATWPGWDIARGISLYCAGAGDSPAGYVLDGWGGVHPLGGAPGATGAYWPGWDIARGIVARPDGVGGYVVDGWGGLHPFGHAAPLRQTTTGRAGTSPVASRWNRTRRRGTSSTGGAGSA